eukprot:symbB.v1.2.035639.t1/scaffold4851.1/size33913/2
MADGVLITPQFLQGVQEARRQEVHQSVESLKSRVSEMKKTQRHREPRGVVMRGPLPLREVRKRHIQVSITPHKEVVPSAGLPMRVANLSEEVAETRQKWVREVDALKTVEAKEEAAAANLSRFRRQVDDRQRSDVGEEKVLDLQHQESELSLKKSRLQEECALMRPKVQHAEMVAQQAEEHTMKCLRDVSHAQQQLLVAKQAALQLQSNESFEDVVVLQKSSEAEQLACASLMEEAQLLQQAEEQTHERLKVEEAASQKQVEEHLAHCRHLEEELRKAELDRHQ